MDLRLTDEQTALRETLRRLLDRRLDELTAQLPVAPRHDRAQVLADAQGVGLFALGLPESVGGLGTFEDLALAHEELGRGLAAPVLTTTSVATRLLLHTAGARCDQLLAPVVDGSRTVSVADDPQQQPTLSTAGGSARLDGKVRRVVDARDADEVLVVARTPTGHAVVATPPDAPGVGWVDEQQAADVAHATMTFADVIVDPEQVVTDAADLGLTAYRTEATVLAAARAVGGGRAVLDRTVAYVRTREQFDRPIGTFQAVQHQLADVATDVDAAALAVGQAASGITSAASGGEVARLAAIASLAATDAFRRATLVAHQLHGGMGFVLDSPLHLWSARAVGDPTLLHARRHLLDGLAAASGIGAHRVTVAPDHRFART